MAHSGIFDYSSEGSPGPQSHASISSSYESSDWHEYDQDQAQAIASASTLTSTFKCSCARKASRLLKKIPMDGVISFDAVMQLHHCVVEQWRQTTRCRHCNNGNTNNGNANNANVTCALTTASEKLISLFEATTHAYTATDCFTQTSPGRSGSAHLFSPTLPITTVTCTRTQMTLGGFLLQDDEANILAAQIIYKSLVTHHSLLRDFQSTQAQHDSDQSFIDDGGGLQHIIDRLLRLLGRIQWEQDTIER
ncbi:hypothetical protein BDP81DRAFT_426609 [Colletotrichum phormii]|uniref:Uncharacterized protein n=1 Tax=Colletotrichum phormii TaxID=359342 RepID=A0AAJ0EFK5_9PEZI|nr:uncharacterized protein BDP81DRAFT_426609 [Colletotrichum phormii]KAK1637089.1 hypothetical protein BDP81DRAFT_426609 [Colletotrichum phormii]